MIVSLFPLTFPNMFFCSFLAMLIASVIGFVVLGFGKVSGA
jgi:hypothetical protein